MKKLKVFLNKNKNYISLLLVLCMLASIPFAAEKILATSIKDHEDKKNEAQSNLDKEKDNIEDLENKQDETLDDIDAAKEKLSALLEQQEILEGEIQITETDLEHTREDLEVAKADATKQYEDMKLRIQYMYENSSNDSIWAAVLEAESFTDMLNRLEYIASVHEADRRLTEQYQAIVVEVEEKERLLMVKQDELLMQQEAYLGQQAEIEDMIASLEDAVTEYETQLAEAEARAEEYKKIIEEQDRLIKEQLAATGAGPNPNYPGGQNVSGEELVAFALQFVGNPYVWAGESLTEGCDCSGFVYSVYKHFGYITVHYSFAYLNEGVPVDIEDIRPGDIVVYERSSRGTGHVAIYAGNGKIVEAQSSTAGITCDRSIFNNRAIIGIRRILTH